MTLLTSAPGHKVNRMVDHVVPAKVRMLLNEVFQCALELRHLELSRVEVQGCGVRQVVRGKGGWSCRKFALRTGLVN